VTGFFELRSEIEHDKEEVVIHCAAHTNVDGCEEWPLDATDVNMGGTFALAGAFKGKIVYISTDYVFDGTTGPYVEYSSPNPINIYGWSKLGGELVLKARKNPDDLIVRTTMLFGPDGDDFVSKVAEKLLSGEPVYLPDNLYGSPTYIPHLAEDILLAVKKGTSGVLNLAGGPAPISRYRFGQRIAEAAGLSTDLVRRGGPPLGTALRPLRVGLKTDKAVRLGFPYRDPYRELKQVIDRHRKAERQ
jgi:dTDP-4-dehydrorhamnose reductase